MATNHNEEVFEVAGEEIFELPGDPGVFLPLNPTSSSSKTGVHMKDDGRVNIDWNSSVLRRFSKLYDGPILAPSATLPPEYSEQDTQPPYDPVGEYPQPARESKKSWTVRLNIVIQVVGSRGDVQPFIALGNELQRYGHRVRLATHDVFEIFVRDSGLEFYPIGGDPEELMAYMVKNPGLIPSMKSLQAGEIRRKRFMVREMLDGCWRSCIEPDMAAQIPFVADAIIANPPSFAHIHCAQALGIPVHLMFTMPWSRTAAFPHPLANVKGGDGADQNLKNSISYGVVNWLTWHGVGDVINKWRKDLDLDEIAMFEGPYIAELLKIPFTYCWSPALVAKPSDWPSHIDVCGFFFRDSPRYDPPDDLQAFLASGPPPMYVGFGSIVVEDPGTLTAVIIDAVKTVGARAIISKGWSNLVGENNDNIYYIGDCPHEWLFEHVAAVVHHGGAGTTACGLRKSKPTLIVPFFGDQPFWGGMVAAAGAGPAPIPHRELTVDALADGLRYCLSDQAITAASLIAAKMNNEAGVSAAVSSFHRNLPLERLQCDLCPWQPAVWSFSKNGQKMKLSRVAAHILVTKGFMDKKHLTTHASKSISIENLRWDPITGGSSAVIFTATDLATSFLGTFYKPVREYRSYQQRLEYKTSGSKFKPAAKGSESRTSVDTRSTSHEKELQNIDSEDNHGSVKLPQQSRAKLLGRMAGASAKSLGSFAPTALKGMTVDIPLALTEGLRNAPRYWGEEPQDHGPVTDIKSGFTVAGKGFAWGMAEALSDIVVKPYQGIQEDGARGAVKGIGKGVANMASKAGCAMFGVFVYPSAGISQSLRSSIHSRTRKVIARARHDEGIWLLDSGQHDDSILDIVSLFKQKMERIKS